MVAEDIPEILEMTTSISNPISAKQTVKSYSDTVRADDKFQQVKRKSRVVYGKSTKKYIESSTGSTIWRVYFWSRFGI